MREKGNTRPDITRMALEREDAHHAENIQFRTLFSLSSDYCYLVSPDGIILDVNESVTKHLGYRSEELIGRPIGAAVYAPLSRERMDMLFTRLKQDKNVTGEELAILTKDGKERRVILNASSVFDRDCRLLYIIFIQNDITEKRARETKLKQSEERYRYFVENANSIILQWDTAGNILYMNEYGLQLFGYENEEILGKNVIGTIVGEKDITGKDLVKMIEGICRNPENYTVNENENTRKDGQVLWISWRNKSIIDESGNLTGILSIGQDVTVRKQIERKLIESEQRYRELYDNIATGVAIYEPVDDGNDFIIKSLNKAAQKIFRVSAREVQGKRVTDVFSRIKDVGLFDVFKGVSATGESASLPSALYEDGRISIWIDNYTFRLPSGEIVAVYDDRTS